MHRTLVASVVISAALAFVPHASAGAVSWTVQTQPFSLSFSDSGRVLTGDRGIVYVLGNGSRHHTTKVIATKEGRTAASRTYTFATDEAGRTVRLTVSRSGDGVRSAWSVLPTDGVDYVLATLAASRSQHFLGGGEQVGTVDLSRRIVRLKVWNACSSSAPTPSFLSSGGYGVLVDSTSVGSLAFPGAVNGPECQWGTSPCPVASSVDAVQICERGAALPYAVFGGTLPEVQQAMTAVTGRPVLPKPSEFELIKWRDAVRGRADLLDDVRQLQSRGIPIGWELLDNPWETCLGSLTFDPARFPDPKGLIRTLAADGVRLMAWISPLVNPTCGAARGYVTLAGDESDNATIDLTNAASVSELERRLTALLRLGVRGVKGDRGDEIDLEHASLAAGWGQTLHNTYPVLFERAVAQAAATAGQPQLPAIFRAAFAGSGSLVSGFWAGDQSGDLNGFRAAIRSAATAGLGGYSTWGSDIGGYNSEGLRADLFIRWSQLGAVSPVFEVGGRGPQQRFWQFGAATTASFRSSAVLHYELYPYLYGLAQRAHATGLPILRPLAFGYPNDAAAWRNELELLVGDDLLAAPVDSLGNVVDFRVYLPKGRWTDVFTGAAHDGGGTVVRHTPLGDFPLYLRAGAAIPFNLRAQKVWSSPWGLNELQRPGRTGWLYAPSGRTAVAGLTANAGKDGGRRLEVAPSAGASQVLMLGQSRPSTVEVNGRRVAPRADLRGVAAGWRMQSRPFPGLLLKLPRGATAVIR